MNSIKLRLITVVFLVSVCLISLIAVGSFGEDGETTRKPVFPVPGIDNLAALSYDQHNACIYQLLDNREHLKQVLLRQLNSTDSDEVRSAIISIFGYYRMAEVVPVIAKYVTLRNAYPKMTTPRSLIGIYPTVDALVEIGQPSVPYMIINIKTSDDKKVREFSADVIRKIYGTDISKYVLEKELEKLKDDTYKQRIKEAIN